MRTSPVGRAGGDRPEWVWGPVVSREREAGGGGEGLMGVSGRSGGQGGPSNREAETACRRQGGGPWGPLGAGVGAGGQPASITPWDRRGDGGSGRTWGCQHAQPPPWPGPRTRVALGRLLIVSVL